MIAVLPICLVRLRPDMRAFGSWATRCRFVRPGTDEGYAVHAALAAALGEAAPRPFVLTEEAGEAVLYGYAEGAAEQVQEAFSLPATGEEAAFLRVEEATVRPMPLLRPGRPLGFRLRTRPVVRVKPEGATRDIKTRREMDAAPWAAVRAQAADEEVPSKEDAYVAWLRDRLAARDVTLGYARLLSMARTRVLRRPKEGEARSAKVIEGPDVTFDGMLSLGSGTDLPALLRSGVGRHTAFGYGCLLLRPA